MSSFIIVGEKKSQVTVGGATFDAVIAWLRLNATSGLLVEDKLFESRLGGADIGMLNLTDVKESTEVRLVQLLESIMCPNHEFWKVWVKQVEYADCFEDKTQQTGNVDEALRQFTLSYRKQIANLVHTLREVVNTRRGWREGLSCQKRLLEVLRVFERDLFVAQAAAAGVQLGDTQSLHKWAKGIGYRGSLPIFRKSKSQVVDR